MITIKRFASFQDIESEWKVASKEVNHYPFQSFWYQKLFAETFSQLDRIYLLGIYKDQTLLAIGGFEVDDNIVRFLGTRDVSITEGLSQDITDFGDLLYTKDAGGHIEAIWKKIQAFFPGKSIELDYVREDSLTYRYFLQTNAQIQQQEVSPYISLPPTWESYLESLSKKDRHELKRKIKRLETHTSYKMCTDHSISGDFEQFIALHRLSDTQKKKFMDEKMKDFFWKLTTTEKDEWTVHICTMLVDDKIVAAVMVFSTSESILLYNSGFDPEYSYFSVGLLIKAFLIQHAIEDGKKVYDFLRGNERYKYDLGAKDMPLFKIIPKFGK